MSYAVQYTINTLTGAYAQKYSVIWYDAARFEALFDKLDSPLKGFAASSDHREFDAYACFQSVMKVLKELVKMQKKPMCTAIERETDGVKVSDSRFADTDALGAFEACAYGDCGICRRGTSETPFEEIQGEKGVYRAVMSTVIKCYKDDLMNMLNLCEEAMAKGGKLIAQTVPNDTPAPPPLFRL